MKPGERLKIIFVTPRLAKDWVNAAKMLKEKGHVVKAVCPANENPSLQTVQAGGIEAILLSMPRGGGIFSIPSLFFKVPAVILRFYFIFRKERPDVVYYFTFPSSLWARVASWLARVPVRASKINGPAIFGVPAFSFAELSTAFMDTVILASCKMIERTYKRSRHLRNKVHLNYFGFAQDNFLREPNGSNIRKEFSIPEGAPLVVMVALMYCPRRWLFKGANIKGHDIFIRAARIIKESNPDVRFMIVGDDALPGLGVRAGLERMAGDLGLKDTIIFTGFRKDIPEILAASDIAVVPSLTENCGGAVEPLLMKKPVVASNVGGLPDVVIDGITGILVRPGEPDALANGIMKLLSLPAETRLRMGEEGRELVKKLFDLRKVTDEMERIFHREMDKRL
ncbi:MAG: glycosyltransferase [Deltaproteobacteria bacterium]|nr:glycosyltransferase [Deltaproteobacteria bacterium]